MILFLSVSDYSQPFLTKSTQHGTYNYLFNLTYFYSRDRFKRQSSKDIMKSQIDMRGSLHVGYCCSYIYGQILVVHPSECNQLSCSYTFQHGNRTKKQQTVTYITIDCEGYKPFISSNTVFLNRKLNNFFSNK